MPDIQVEKEDKFKKLKPSERDELASTISGWWESFHNKRQSQIATAQKLTKYVYLNQADRNKTAAWKSNIKENKIYTTWDSMKSVMWKEIWSNEEQMFDVAGTSKETEKVAEKQKESVVYALKKMDAGVQFDKATDNWGIYGDFIYKTDWKKRVKKVKRFDAFRGFTEVELPLQENANIEAINPMFFNFDTTKYRYGDSESWLSTPKIYKRFATVEEIKNNPLYKLTKEQISELDEGDNTKVVDIEDDNNLAKAKKYGDQYEVLYLQGDIKFNGVLYKNIVAEVFAGRYLIYFDENPVYICPFVWDCTQLDPETGRGISPLKAILDMCQGKEDLINSVSDIAKLNANPPVWGSDSFLKEKYKNGLVPYEPGKYLEYDNSYQGGYPQTVKFDSSGLGDVISLLANDISDASSINANVMGNIEQGRRTATEMQLARNGSDARVAMKLDKIYQINLKVIENVAELLAMFKDGDELLFIDDKGQRTEVEITNAIRQGNYQYFYEDRNALLDRRQKFQEAFTMLNSAGQNPELAAHIDWIEALKTGLEMTGFDNPDKFFKSEEESQIDEAANYIKQLPEPFQMEIMQTVQPMLQRANVLMQQQGGNNGNQVPQTMV
jgi:hypothetical protein